MKMLVVNQKPHRDWDKSNNKPGKRIGTTYTVVRRKLRGPVLIDVKVPGDFDSITMDEIKRSEAACSAVWADFTDFEEDCYTREGKPVFFGTASAVKAINSDDDFIDIE